MTNEKNLKPVRTKEEARIRGAAGGRASGEARRRRKTLKENMDLLLSLNVSNPKDKAKLVKMGIDAKDIDNAMLLTSALFLKAKNGDVAAAKEIREWLGESGKNEMAIQENNLLEAITASTAEEISTDDVPEIE